MKIQLIDPCNIHGEWCEEGTLVTTLIEVPEDTPRQYAVEDLKSCLQAFFDDSEG